MAGDGGAPESAPAADTWQPVTPLQGQLPQVLAPGAVEPTATVLNLEAAIDTLVHERGEQAKAQQAGGGEGDDDGSGGKRRRKKKLGKATSGAQKTVSFLKLFSHADRYDRLLMLAGTIGALGLGVTMPLLSLLLGQLTDAFGKNTATLDHVIHAVDAVAVKFLYVAVGAAVAAYLQTACWMLTAERQSARIRRQFLRAVLRQDIAFFDVETSTGEVIGRMSGDIVLLQEGMGEKVGQYIQLMTTFLGGFAMAFARGWQLSLVMLSAFPLLVACGATMAIVISRVATLGQAAYADAGTVVEQNVGAIRTVASFAGEEKAARQYERSLDKAYRMGVSQGAASGLGMGVTMFVLFGTYALALWYGSILIARAGSGYTGGTVINVLVAIIVGGMSLGQASPNIAAFAAGKAAAYKIYEVMERTPAIDSSDASGLVPEHVEGEIELRHVKFAYPSRPDVLVFEDFSLKIARGQTVALVGESGSGKSTVVSLLERFYDPLGGQITLDGTDLRALQLRWLRRRIGLVAQEPALFGASIRENIAYGAEGTPRGDDIVAAAKMANAHNFISKLPRGYDTEVGERGAQPSGGQKQRVAIARALLRDPRVLLLDEATSALDAESERVVQSALNAAMAGRTTVVVAHRLSTVRGADAIAVLQRGKIVETGTHASLLARPGGAYAQLVHLQEMESPSEGGAPAAVAQSPSSRLDTEGAAEGPAQNGTAVGGGESTGSLNRQASGGGSGRRSGIFERRKRAKVEEELIPLPSRAAADLVLARDTSGLAKKLRRFLRIGKGRRPPPGGEGEEEGGGSDPDPEAGRAVPPARERDVSFARMARLNAPEWPLLLLAAAAATGQGLVFPFFSILLSSIISTFYESNAHGKMRRDANHWALMFLALAAATFAFVATEFSLFALAGARLVRRVRALTFAKVLRQEMAYFDEPANSSGAIGARLSTDAAQVRSMVGDRLGLLVQNLATIVAGLVIAFTASWRLALVVISVVPLLALVGTMQSKTLKGFAASAKVMYEDASRVANDAVSAIRTVAAFSAEERVVALYDARCAAPLRAGLRRGHVSGLGLAAANFCMFSVYALAYWYGGILVHERRATFKEVFRVFFAIVMSAMGVAQSMGMAPDMTSVQLAVNSIFKILDRRSAIDPEAPGSTLPAVAGALELEHVTFRYPSRPSVAVLNDFCLSVRAGETVALVGESGSGKSTVIALIERFYDPEGGAVRLDGADVRRLQLKWLRRHVGLVSQEPVLFNASIRDNILYGARGDDGGGGGGGGAGEEEEMEAAARAANAHGFISSLPDGYGTLVGERGVQLSGGQKQRVAIARALAKRPEVLLLDEATSALDAESERVVQDALDRAAVGRTTVIVAHRLTTVRGADAIAVLRRGAVAERGRHEELLARPGGAYAALVRLHTQR